MYVRRWPRISASSRTPPSDMRTNSRPVARAIDSPIEVLPVPGGPIRVRIAPERLSSSMPRSSRSLLDGDVLDDAVLDVLEAGVVGVEHLAGVRPGRAARRSACSTARRSASPGRSGSSTDSPDCSPMRSRRPSSLVGLLARPPRACRRRRSSCGTPRRPMRRVLAQLAPDRLHLLAQEVLALLLVGARDWTSSRILRRSCSSVEPLALDAHGELEALGDVERLEDLDLLLEGDVGRVADRVGQRARLDDRAQERATRSSAPRSSRISSTTARYSRSSSRVRPSTGTSSGCSLTSTREAAGAVGVRRAGDAAGDAGERDGAAAAGEADAVGDLGDRADLGELAVVAGDEQHALLVAHVDGEGDVHGGEDDGVVEGDEQERSHTSGFLRNSCLRIVRKGSSGGERTQGGSAPDLSWT